MTWRGGLMEGDRQNMRERQNAAQGKAMAKAGFEQPFYIVDVDDDFEVKAKPDGQPITAFSCADFETAVEIAMAMNVVWQTLQYGQPDPDLWKEFAGRGFDKLYTPDDKMEFSISSPIWA